MQNASRRQKPAGKLPSDETALPCLTGMLTTATPIPLPGPDRPQGSRRVGLPGRHMCGHAKLTWLTTKAAVTALVQMCTDSWPSASLGRIFSHSVLRLAPGDVTEGGLPKLSWSLTVPQGRSTSRN